MKNGKPLILIVEDIGEYQDCWRRNLEPEFEILPATSIEEAQRLFEANGPEIDVIVMDACVPGDNPTTPPLVEEFRKTFTGPMIAASGLFEYREILMQAGCSHRAHKWDVPEVVREAMNSPRVTRS